MSKIGRNEPCPCGSGRKYKHCCLPEHEAQQETERDLGPVPLRDPRFGNRAWVPTTRHEPPDHVIEHPLAPSLAHAFSFSDRRRGRAIFETDSVHNLSLHEQVLSACVDDASQHLHPMVKLSQADENDTTQVRVSCDCRQGNYCRHVYAVLLRHDADLLGDQANVEPDPHSLAEVITHQLWQADSNVAATLPMLQQSDTLARQIAARAADIATDWAKPGSIDDPYTDDDDFDEFDNELAAQGLDRFGRRVVTGESQMQQLEALHRNGIPTELRRPTRLQYFLDPRSEQLTLVLKRRTLAQSGKWGQLSRVTKQDVDKLRLDAEDRSILAGMRGACSDEDWYSGGFSRGRFHRGQRPREHDPTVPMQIDPVLAAVMLPRMIATGRCYLSEVYEQSSTRSLAPALVMAGGERARFVVRSDPDADGFALLGEFRRGDEVWAATKAPGPVPDKFPVLLGHEHVAIGTTVYELEPIADLPLAHSLLQHGPLSAGPDKREVFLARFVELPGARHLEDDALVAPTAQALQARLTIEDPTKSRKHSLPAQVEFDYGEGDVARPAEKRTHFLRDGLLRPRDFSAEAKCLAQLEDFDIVFEIANAGSLDPDEGQTDAFVPKQRIDECIFALIDAGWEVFAAGMPIRRGASPSLNVSSGKDWFEIEGHVDFDGVLVELPELLRLRGQKHQALIRLDDGSLGILASDWLDRWQGLLELAEVKDGVLRLRSTQAWLLDAMLADNAAKINVDQAFEKARLALRGHETIEPCRTPRGFGTKLRGYQREGLAWLLFLHRLGLGGCLADDMGLGKTVQVLALLERLRREHKGKRRKPALVVAPRSLLDNWQREAKRFCPELETVLYFGAQRHKSHSSSIEDGFSDYDMVLTTYGTMRRDIEKLAKVRFHYAILDESQVIKNDKSQVSKAARLIQAEHRLTMTGTPIENHLGEIWSMFEFLNPGMLGRSKVFKDLAGLSGAASDGASDFLLQLNAALRPFLLRRTKGEVLHDLPAKSEQILHVELSKVQRKKYDELRHYYRAKLLGALDEKKGLGGQHMHVLEALLRLRQAACHIGLLGKEHVTAESGKFNALLPMLEELCAEGHKALVFSQFTSLLALLKPELDSRGIRYEYLDGKTRDRQERVDHFQSDPDCRIFLISLKAGGLGLNLTAADYVFLLDPWWNPAVENQAIDRTHRIGQTRKVMAYRLIAKDTVEERVAELQDEKRKLVDAVLAGGGGGLKGLTVADVARLLE